MTAPYCSLSRPRTRAPPPALYIVDKYIVYRYIRRMRTVVNLQEPTFLILAALAGGDLHGYGIIKEVEALSDGRVRLSPGTLYGALDRLKNEGLVETAGEERIEGRLRRYYCLTDSGASTLQQEIDRQERVTLVARAKLQTRRSRPASSPRPVEAS
jgi:PadR family transcriptional regulator PadR